MNTRMLVTLGTVAVIGLVLVVGCNVFVRGGGEAVYAPPPPPAVVYATEPPPPVIVEPVPVLQPGFIWIDGYWHWDGGRYSWIRGRAERPPHERAMWVAPRYEKAGNGYQYQAGHWADKGAAPAAKGGPGGPPPGKGGPGGPPPGKGYDR